MLAVLSGLSILCVIAMNESSRNDINEGTRARHFDDGSDAVVTT